MLTVATIYSGAPFRNPVGRAIEEFSQFFYNDPRRLTAVVTMLVTPMAGIALFAVVMVVVAVAKRLTERFKQLPAPGLGRGHGGVCWWWPPCSPPGTTSTGTWCCSATNTTR